MSVIRASLKNRTITALAAVALSSSLSSCTWLQRPQLTPQPRTQAQTQAHILPDHRTRELLAIMNEARQKRGRPILVVDRRLTRSAKGHSNSMAKHRYFSHIGRDGSHFQARMQRQGYPLSYSAENLAMAYDARTAFRLWWESKGHRKNMMNKRYTHVGLAKTGKYWTANYAAQNLP